MSKLIHSSLRGYLCGGALAAGLMAGGSAALAQEQTLDPMMVVELYTSQGCNACPPADAMLAELTGRDDVLPLALHVDYWDYIGWKDGFANPEFTMRQKAYARAAGERSIFTPQFVVGGLDHVVGVKPMKLVEALQAADDRLGEVVATLEPVAGTDRQFEVTLHAPDGVASDMPVLIDLVRYEPQQTVNIEHGENAGRTVTYVNIVRSWENLTAWDGRDTWRGRITIGGDEDAALVIQKFGPGEVLTAMRLP